MPCMTKALHTQSTPLTSADIPRALSCAETAEKIGVTVAALTNMRYRGEGPAYIKRGRSVTYLPEDIVAWWDSLRVNGGK